MAAKTITAGFLTAGISAGVEDDNANGGTAWIEFDGITVAEIAVAVTEDGDLAITCEACDGSTKPAEGFIPKEDR